MAPIKKRGCRFAAPFFILFISLLLPVSYEIGNRSVVAAFASLRKKASRNFVIVTVIFYAVAARTFTRARLISAGALSQSGLFFAFHINLRKSVES